MSNKIKLVFVNQVLGAEVIVQVPADEFQGRAQKLIEFTEYPYTTQPIDQAHVKIQYVLTLDDKLKFKNIMETFDHSVTLVVNAIGFICHTLTAANKSITDKDIRRVKTFRFELVDHPERSDLSILRVIFDPSKNHYSKLTFESVGSNTIH